MTKLVEIYAAYITTTCCTSFSDTPPLSPGLALRDPQSGPPPKARRKRVAEKDMDGSRMSNFSWFSKDLGFFRRKVTRSCFSQLQIPKKFWSFVFEYFHNGLERNCHKLWPNCAPDRSNWAQSRHGHWLPQASTLLGRLGWRAIPPIMVP